MGDLDGRAHQQALRDAAAKVRYPSAAPQAALAWFLSRGWKVRFIGTAVTLFLAYALGTTVLELAGVRTPRDTARQQARLARDQAEQEAADAKKRAEQAERQAWKLANDPAHQFQKALYVLVGAEKPPFREVEAAMKIAEKYYATPKTFRGDAVEAITIMAQVEAAELMRSEPLAALIMRNLGRVHESAITSALIAFYKVQPLGQPQYMTAYDHIPDRLPLFPVLPAPRKPPTYSIEGKMPTPEDLAVYQRNAAMRDIQNAIVGIYIDCEEHFRPLYLEHLTALFDRHLSFTSVATSKLQDTAFPAFLLTPNATPNERLHGALIILFGGVLTTPVRQAVLDTPTILLGNQCPAERKSFFSFERFFLRGVNFADDAVALKNYRAIVAEQRKSNASSMLSRLTR